MPCFWTLMEKMHIFSQIFIYLFISSTFTTHKKLGFVCVKKGYQFSPAARTPTLKNRHFNTSLSRSVRRSRACLSPARWWRWEVPCAAAWGLWKPSTAAGARAAAAPAAPRRTLTASSEAAKTYVQKKLLRSLEIFCTFGHKLLKYGISSLIRNKPWAFLSITYYYDVKLYYGTDVPILLVLILCKLIKICSHVLSVSLRLWAEKKNGRIRRDKIIAKLNPNDAVFVCAPLHNLELILG